MDQVGKLPQIGVEASKLGDGIAVEVKVVLDASGPKLGRVWGATLNFLARFFSTKAWKRAMLELEESGFRHSTAGGASSGGGASVDICAEGVVSWASLARRSSYRVAGVEASPVAHQKGP